MLIARLVPWQNGFLTRGADAVGRGVILPRQHVDLKPYDHHLFLGERPPFERSNKTGEAKPAWRGRLVGELRVKER